MTRKNPVTPWANALSIALKVWCDNNGYKPRITLASELGITRNAWDHITRGDTIIGDTDPDIYARIYQKTLLPEADPRKIPSKADGTVRRWPPEVLETWWRDNFPDDINKSVVQSALNGNRVRRENRPVTSNTTGEQWIIDTVRRLEKVKMATPQAREEFYLKNSGILKQLELLAGTLNQPWDERETAISMSMEVEND